MTAAPTGPTGTLSGTVRRADNMSAIGGAEVHVTGPGNRGVAHEPVGPVLDAAAGRHLHRHGHARTASRRQTVSNVAVSQDQTTTKDFNLAPAPALEHDLTTLTDGNGNGKVEPGESFQVDERLVNTGHATATGVSAMLSLVDAGHQHHAGQLRAIRT